MTKIYLIRHAEAEGNLYRRIHGQYNSLITVNGYRQIAALRERFEGIHIDAVYSSDLFRTQATATALTVPKKLPITTDPQLREVNMGSWEDQTWGEIGASDGESLLKFTAADPSWQAPEGENLIEVGERVAQAILKIAKNHPDETIAIFCHGTAIRQAVAVLQGLEPHQWGQLRHGENTAVSQLTLDGDKLTVEDYCDASHITPEISTLAFQSWWKPDSEAKKEVLLCFRPLDLNTESDLYFNARKEAWESTHGRDIPFDGQKFLQDAQLCQSQGSWGIQVITTLEGDTVGVLQLDYTRYGKENCGYIAFYYLLPQFRGQGLAVQLLGGAISAFRKLGATHLRLRCAPYNKVAQNFYKKHGFVKIGDEENSPVPLEILEKYIGYDRMEG